MDVGYQGRFWIFAKKVTGGTYTRVRLDRALANADWMSRFLMEEVTHLTAATSDHGPILLRTEGGQSQGAPKRSFKYETMWEMTRFGKKQLQLGGAL